MGKNLYYDTIELHSKENEFMVLIGKDMPEGT